MTFIPAPTAPSPTADATRARYAAQTVAGSPVASRNCRRCRGTGSTVYTWNNFGICRNCGGDGVVPDYTKAQKEAIERKATATRAATDTLREALKGRHHTQRGTADDAVMHLRDVAPDRFDAMVASINSGRVEAVIDALIAYATEADIYTYWAEQAAARERN